MLYSRRKDYDWQEALRLAVRTATTTGGVIDLSGFKSTLILMYFTAWTDGSHQMSLLHSDSPVLATFSTVPASMLDGTFPLVNAAPTNWIIARLSYLGPKQFIRPRITVTGSPSTGAALGCLIGRGDSMRRRDGVAPGGAGDSGSDTPLESGTVNND